MRTLAYMPLHYGKDYLEYALHSIHDHVDEVLILYTARPSYGHVGKIPNPDSKEELFAICKKFHKVTWQEVINVTRENEHRQRAITYGQNNKYDVLIAVDSDEIWKPGSVREVISEVKDSKFRFHGIAGSQWLHFWRNHKEVNTDGFYPMRAVNLNVKEASQTIIKKGFIYHMGYAISEELMRYKLSCHGHKSEIADNWFRDKWLNYERGVTTHLHPASQDVWIETKDFKGELPYGL